MAVASGTFVCVRLEAQMTVAGTPIHSVLYESTQVRPSADSAPYGAVTRGGAWVMMVALGAGDGGGGM